jgi:hypothetical protein
MHRKQRVFCEVRSRGGTVANVMTWSAYPTEVYRRFPQLQGKWQGINEKGHSPPAPDHGGLQPPSSVAEVFSQIEPNSGFNS